MREKELPKVDVTKYIGKKVQIAVSEIKVTKYGLALVLKTEVLEKISEDVEIRASNFFSFGTDDEGHFIIKDSKLDNFLKSYKIDKEVIPENIEDGLQIPEILGVEVIVQKNVKTGFLDIA